MIMRVTLAVLLFTAVQKKPDEIVAPQPELGLGICAPFGCDVRIQQVFDNTNFPARMRLEAIDLFNNQPNSAEGFIEPASYSVYLSTTSVSSASATADFDANVGPDALKVAAFTIADFSTSFTGTYRIPFAKWFNYIPRSNGNLLLEIRKDRTGDFGDGPIYVDGSVHAPGVTQITDEQGVQRGVAFTVGFVGRVLGPFKHAWVIPFVERPAVAMN